MDKKVKHFVLVHGAGHGAWCWYKVATQLRAAGHRVTALDMAASGVHPKQVDELRSMPDYLRPLMEFMESLPSGDRGGFGRRQRRRRQHICCYGEVPKQD
ncbi:hypothetical protein RHMOL_Rhmol02G0020900 [Rhododendron molle]|uniref:Uncharacterized protein n=1 Tax=Rhododendron molle TaxID=49168 RepID=A0ACC0PME2_RHOML|nr:hypothetical protein RHMOL_Rhmol02G0020900 [Rhododendron molle]